jgi:uncharacterized protein YqjF (DUF2071 family)
MTSAGRVELSQQQMQALAWNFLRSEFTGQTYADWPIDGRIDAYLHHHGLGPVANDGATYSALLETVMANIGPALRRGVLKSPHTPTVSRGIPPSDR